MGIRVFVNQLPVDEFVRWIGRQGPSYLLKLTGVNVSVARGRNMEFQGVYIPLFTYRREAGQIVIELPLWRERKSCALILQETWPWVWFSTTDLTAPEDWEEVDD